MLCCITLDDIPALVFKSQFPSIWRRVVNIFNKTKRPSVIDFVVNVC